MQVAENTCQILGKGASHSQPFENHNIAIDYRTRAIKPPSYSSSRPFDPSIFFQRVVHQPLYTCYDIPICLLYKKNFQSILTLMNNNAWPLFYFKALALSGCEYFALVAC